MRSESCSFIWHPNVVTWNLTAAEGTDGGESSGGALGLDEAAVRRRVADGRLHRVDRGIYAVGHKRLTREGRWMAAVLRCGPGAVLSHRSAGVASPSRA